MKINYKVSRLANQFFFISTLAAWHYSCRKDIREKWISQTGTLTPEEEKALASFSYLMRAKYGFQSPKTYLGEVFYKQSEKTVWLALKKFVKKQEDYAPIKDIFSLFENRFEKAWKKASFASLKVLEDEIGKENVVKFFNTVASLLGDEKIVTRSVTLVIIFSPLGGDQTAAGSANLQEDFITLELPALKKNTWQLSYSLATLGHELGHMCFSKRGGTAMLRDAMKKAHLKERYDQLPFSTQTVLNEAITAAFLPLGALGQLYFSTDLSPLFFSKMPKIIAAEQPQKKKTVIPFYGNLEFWFIWKLFPLSMEYVRNKKQIDKEFIAETALLLKKFVK